MENKIITKEEYLQAVEIVEMYHKQVANQIIIVNSFFKFSMSQFLIEYNYLMSKTLRKELYNFFEENPEYKETCISNFNTRWLSRGWGDIRIFLHEFNDLKDRAIKDKNLIISDNKLI